MTLRESLFRSWLDGKIRELLHDHTLSDEGERRMDEFIDQIVKDNGGSE